MSIEQMRLSDDALGKLSQLALAVELHEKQRFSLRKDIAHVVKLLKVACSSGNNVVKLRLEELSGALNNDSVGFFRTLGVDLSPLPARTSKLTYRGQELKSKSSARASDAGNDNSNTSMPEAGSKKKKIIYRGKVIYR